MVDTELGRWPKQLGRLPSTPVYFDAIRIARRGARVSSARFTASSQAVLQIPHRGRSRPRSDGDDPDPQRLGALDHCLVEAKNALRIETPGDRKVKGVARP